MAAIPRLPPHPKPPTRPPQRPAEGAERPRLKPRPPEPVDEGDKEAEAITARLEGTWTPGGGEQDDSVSIAEPATGDTPPWNDLPKCPDGERIFRQHDQNPEIPLCPSIDAGHRCHKEGGPDGCPLWDRPKAQAEEPAPKTDANPPRRTRKKREE